MTEQELVSMIDQGIVRIATREARFHLITRDPRFCSIEQAGAAMLGHVRCWCCTEAKWITVDPQAIVAHEALNSNAVALG